MDAATDQPKGLLPLGTLLPIIRVEVLICLLLSGTFRAPHCTSVAEVHVQLSKEVMVVYGDL